MGGSRGNAHHHTYGRAPFEPFCTLHRWCTTWHGATTIRFTRRHGNDEERRAAAAAARVPAVAGLPKVLHLAMCGTSTFWFSSIGLGGAGFCSVTCRFQFPSCPRRWRRRGCRSCRGTPSPTPTCVPRARPDHRAARAAAPSRRRVGSCSVVGCLGECAARGCLCTCCSSFTTIGRSAISFYDVPISAGAGLPRGAG